MRIRPRAPELSERAHLREIIAQHETWLDKDPVSQLRHALVWMDQAEAAYEDNPSQFDYLNPLGCGTIAWVQDVALVEARFRKPEENGPREPEEEEKEMDDEEDD